MRKKKEKRGKNEEADDEAEHVTQTLGNKPSLGAGFPRPNR